MSTPRKLRMLVIPAERHPSDHSFLEEVHTRDDARIERTFFMRSHAAQRHQASHWNRAKLEVIPFRPSFLLLHWMSVYFFDARYVWHLWRLTRRERPDVLFIRDLTFPLMFGVLLRPWTRWKVVYQRSFPHEFGWFDPERVSQYKLPWVHTLARRVELYWLRALLGMADAVIPISKRMGDELVAEGLCRPERIHPFGMGVTHGVLEVGPPPERAPGDPLLLVYVGTLALRRRMARLVEAMEIVREQHGVDAHLTVLGGTSAEVTALRAVVERHGATGFIDVAGRIPRHEVYAAMARHHAGAIYIARDPRFVVASTTKLVESLAIGLPCVCTDAVAMHQEMADKTGALVMTDDSAAGFAAGIADLDRRWPELSERARSGRRAIHDEFSYEAARERMERIVVDLVGEG